MLHFWSCNGIGSLDCHAVAKPNYWAPQKSTKQGILFPLSHVGSAVHVLQDIEAVDPEYYKNLRWMLENNITDVLDLTFTEESDYFGKKELVELKPGGKDIRSALLLSPLHPALGTGGGGVGVR